MDQKELDDVAVNQQENECDELLPFSRIAKILKLVTDKKFTKASVKLIQSSTTKFIKEISELSEKQSRIRSKKMDKDQTVIIQQEDVISAIKKGGKKFDFVNFSTEFLEDSFWIKETS
ncbi:Histone-like transcription factor (CBF/NF-Y) and archaeal histone family protein [Cryptosporidium meleagridis]|uniref:Histone-like transcription factor (CBF/NF-Y) and archaeal histone family protein n=1 Tax=Cryptosporidium meleagridis TaxID=93969 RepID=A0A2P4Z587_9CRYT|nr:Histone-like transcription factor (CBF/NF-Y) and archaeal histone family protein [Cryptosporidium meleagridis]